MSRTLRTLLRSCSFSVVEQLWNWWILIESQKHRVRRDLRNHQIQLRHLTEEWIQLHNDDRRKVLGAVFVLRTNLPIACQCPVPFLLHFPLLLVEDIVRNSSWVTHPQKTDNGHWIHTLPGEQHRSASPYARLFIHIFWAWHLLTHHVVIHQTFKISVRKRHMYTYDMFSLKIEKHTRFTDY